MCRSGLVLSDCLFLKSEVFGRRREVWTDSRARFDGALLWQVPVPEHGPVLKARPYGAAPYASALRLQEDPHTNIPFFCCCFLVGGWIYDLFPVCPLMFFVDWLVSTLISMSHYPLEYSGGMFPLAAIPIIIIYHMVHDFQVSGSTSAFLSFFFLSCHCHMWGL